MLIDCDSYSGGEHIAADVLIVGSGCAGISAALRLLDAGLTVAILESGGLHDEAATQALYEGDMLGLSTFQLDSHRYRIFGGSSTRWAGWCARMQAIDFEHRPWIEHSGWPIGLADLEPYYETAEDLLGLSHLWDGHAVAQALGHDLWIPDSSWIENNYFQFSDSRRRLGDRHGHTLFHAHDITVYLHCNVTEIVLDGTLSAVDHLVCKRLDGTTFTASGDTVVLATGGIENARLLLASNQQLPEGVANSSDAVGRYFMEHPHLRRANHWLQHGMPDYEHYTRRDISVDVPGHGLFEQEFVPIWQLSEQLQRDEELVNLSLATHGEPHPDDIETGEFPPEQVARLAQLASENRVVWLTSRAEQLPNPDSRITLNTTELDALGMPRAQLDWQMLDQEWASHRRTLEVIGAKLAENGRGRLWTPTDSRGVDAPPGPGGHHMGTTRMSADPATGVVDADCRAHDVDNLYILGSSVYTTSGAANPTLTLIALAHRFADHLVALP